MNPQQDLCVPDERRLGELASRLCADESGEVRREYCRMFDMAQDEARRRLHEPLTAEDHEAAAALADGVRQCSKVIHQVWNVLHP
jgi:hypothetical protein